MIRTNTIGFVVCLGAILVAIGCGDASSDGTIGSKCEQMCQHGDSCPNLYAENDCVSSCEAAVKEAALLGGTCPSTIDEVLACQMRLTCDELTRRAVGGYYNDDCVAKDEAATQCVSGDPVEPGASDQPGSTDELALACEAVCDAVDHCPSLFAEPDCVQICVDGFRAAENGSDSCAEAIVNTVTCQAAMTCEELSNRVNGRGIHDSCREADRFAEQRCF